MYFSLSIKYLEVQPGANQILPNNILLNKVISSKYIMVNIKQNFSFAIILRLEKLVVEFSTFDCFFFA